MKKIFRLMLAVAAVASVASCAKEDVSVAPVGQEVEVAFVADLGALGTRAIADGTTVDEVAWAIYEDGADAPLENLQGTLVLNGKQATLNVRLATGKTYDLAFFAYKAVEAKEELKGVVDPVHYDVVWAEKKVCMKLDPKPANDETRDCFWYVRHDLKIEGPVSETFTLTRPLAQLNIGVTAQDVLDAQKAGFEVSDSQLTVNTYTQFNMFDGSLSETASIPVTFDRADSPVDAADVLKVKDDATDYKYLATTYLLVNDKVTSDVTVTLWDKAGVELNTLNYSYVPFQRNYRTNILGALLTNPAVFTIVVDERFNEPDNIVFHAFEYGGEVTLQGDMTVGHTLYVKKDATLNLNGYTLKNHKDNVYTDLIIVEKGATLTINGNGTLEAVTGNDGYAVIAEGTVIINGGTIKSGVDAAGEPNAVVYARGEGKVFVNGGTFPNDNASKFVLNKKDADRATTTIEVRGGKFQTFDPANNVAEGPNTNFCAEGYGTIEKDGWYEVVEAKDYVLYADYIEVYTAAGLAKWAYIVNNEDKGFGVKLMANIALPAKVLAEDAANETYVYTDTDITVTEGVPSGNNWPEISSYEKSQPNFFNGKVDGNGMTISGLRINHDLGASGFICWTKGAIVENLTFDDAVVYNKGGNLGESYTGIVIGRCWDGSHVANVDITNSSVTGYTEVGALVGRLYHRTEKANGEWLGEKMAYVTYCTTDKNTVVKGDHNVGGIVGMNYGCVVGQCVNNADVTARTQVGGIAGAHQSYYKKTDAFILACQTTAEATITATEKYAGAFAGYTRRDNSSHTNTRVWIVGCASESTVVAPEAGTMVGNCIKNNGEYGNCIAACYAVTNDTKFAANGNPQIEAAYNFAAATDATQADVDAMNAAIEAFNVSPDNAYVNGDAGAEMLKRWTLTAAGPVLQ